MIAAKKVKKAYDRYAHGYDAGTDMQRGLADKIVEAISSERIKYSRALDIGCGTGYLTKRLNATGCDMSFGMLNCAKSKNSRYAQSDAVNLAFKDSTFDLVISNAAYQWVSDLRAAFKEARRILKPRGKFCFTIFNKNTLHELQNVCKDINIASRNFPDEAVLCSYLGEAGFRIDLTGTLVYKKHYKDLWQLLKALKDRGSTSVVNKDIRGLGWRKILQQANDLYAERFGSENGILATYEVFLIKCSINQYL